MMQQIAIVLLVCVPELFAGQIYKGGEFRTKESFLYGRFEVRMKTIQRDGMLTSFFTYNDMVPFTSAQWNEIDIEVMGRYTDDVQYNTITPGQTNHVGRSRVPFNPALDYHTYAIEWTPSSVAWFIDGAESYRQTGAQIQTLAYAQKIMMNVWIQSAVNWSGMWNPASLPAFAYYDHVSYSSHTPGKGTSGTNNDFTLQWKDDFNAFDETRWSKASHTFGGNLCDFIPENIVFRDGKMIICLTSETAIGYQDLVPPGVSSARAEADGVVVTYTEEVDSATAVNASNYIITGNTISSVTMHADNRAVRLKVAGYDTSTLSNVIIRNIKDLFTPANTLGGKSVTIAKPQRLALPVKINCGGAAYNEYLADQMWSPELEYGYLDGTVVQNSAAVSGGADPYIFRSAVNGAAEYRVRVPNGTYAVFLLMSENYFTVAGKRLFNVSVQGIAAETNLDLFARVGKGVQYQKMVPNVKVTEGVIDIHFMSLLDYAVINAISIIQISTTGINETPHGTPHDWYVGRNFPNPFNGSTVIPFTLPDTDNIRIEIYDALGRRVSAHTLGAVERGTHTFTWNGRNDRGLAVSSGPYYYIVKGARNAAAQKMVLVQ